MPIRPENKSRYPKDWPEISKRIRFERAQNQCEQTIGGKRCPAINYQPHPVTGSKVILTVAHLDHTPENCADDNLKAMCQRCHLAYDIKIHERNRWKNKRCKETTDLLGDAAP